MGKKAKFPILLANLQDRKTQKPVFQPYLIKEMGIRVGLLGLVSDRFAGSLPLQDKETFNLAEPMEAAREVIEELKKKNCKVIIVLAHMEESEQKKLAEAFREVYFVVSGHTRDMKRQPVGVNNAQIVAVGTRGEYSGKWIFSSRTNRTELIFCPIIGSSLSRVSTGITPRRPSWWINSGPTPNRCIWRRAKIPLRKKLPRRKPVPMLTQFPISWGTNSAFRAINCSRRIGREPVMPRLIKPWSGTKGVGSHLPSLPHDGIRRSFRLPPDVLENVQCESCHGPRRGHPENGQKFPPVSEKQCLVCHNPAKSPNFDYVSYLAKVRCPALK